jgi:hypothetical protein
MQHINLMAKLGDFAGNQKEVYLLTACFSYNNSRYDGVFLTTYELVHSALYHGMHGGGHDHFFVLKCLVEPNQELKMHLESSDYYLDNGEHKKLIVDQQSTFSDWICQYLQDHTSEMLMTKYFNSRGNCTVSFIDINIILFIPKEKQTKSMIVLILLNRPQLL